MEKYTYSFVKNLSSGKYVNHNFSFSVYFPFVSHILPNENMGFCILTNMKKFLGRVELIGIWRRFTQLLIVYKYFLKIDFQDKPRQCIKSRDITLPTKVCLVKAIFFLVFIYGCESWTINKAGCWRIDAFELWYWRRLVRAPWTAGISNQWIIKEISA